MKPHLYWVTMRLDDRIAAKTQEERNRYGAFLLAEIADYLAEARGRA